MYKHTIDIQSSYIFCFISLCHFVLSFVPTGLKLIFQFGTGLETPAKLAPSPLPNSPNMGKFLSGVLSKCDSSGWLFCGCRECFRCECFRCECLRCFRRECLNIFSNIKISSLDRWRLRKFVCVSTASPNESTIIKHHFKRRIFYKSYLSFIMQIFKT